MQFLIGAPETFWSASAIQKIHTSITPYAGSNNFMSDITIAPFRSYRSLGSLAGLFCLIILCILYPFYSLF